MRPSRFTAPSRAAARAGLPLSRAIAGARSTVVAASVLVLGSAFVRGSALVLGSVLVLGSAFVLGAALLPGSAVAAPSTAGEQAPDFALPFATADTISFEPARLSEAAARGPVVLAFYPADWSPGCTREVCTLRDAFAELASLDATVWGISGDTVFSHRAWAEHHGLPFPLLSDLKHEAALLYDSFNAESGLTRRTVYVVGKDMRVLYADADYSVKDDADFNALKSALARAAD